MSHFLRNLLKLLVCSQVTFVLVEKFEDTKGEIRIRKSKDKQFYLRYAMLDLILHLYTTCSRSTRYYYHVY